MYVCVLCSANLISFYITLCFGVYIVFRQRLTDSKFLLRCIACRLTELGSDLCTAQRNTDMI